MESSSVRVTAHLQQANPLYDSRCTWHCVCMGHTRAVPCRGDGCLVYLIIIMYKYSNWHQFNTYIHVPRGIPPSHLGPSAVYLVERLRAARSVSNDVIDAN